jgi:hypothetical protein
MLKSFYSICVRSPGFDGKNFSAIGRAPPDNSAGLAGFGTNNFKLSVLKRLYFLEIFY